MNSVMMEGISNLWSRALSVALLALIIRSRFQYKLQKKNSKRFPYLIPTAPYFTLPSLLELARRIRPASTEGNSPRTKSWQKWIVGKVRCFRLHPTSRLNQIENPAKIFTKITTPPQNTLQSWPTNPK